MELSKILAQLYNYFDDNKYNKHHKKEIHNLLDKLKRKEHRLEKDLASAKNELTKKTIKRSLKVIRAQKKKGKNVLSH